MLNNFLLSLLFIFITDNSYSQLKFKILDSLISHNNKKLLKDHSFVTEISEIIVNLNSNKVEFQLMDRLVYFSIRNEIEFDSATFFKLKNKYIKIKIDTIDFSESKINSYGYGKNILIILNPIFDGWLSVEKINRINEIEKFGIKVNNPKKFKIYIPYYFINYNRDISREIFIYEL